jgi:hypothetical protein
MLEHASAFPLSAAAGSAFGGFARALLLRR